MYKALIVDDEKYIRKSICSRIDWARLGIVVKAEAGNGLEALELMEQIRPQIVLVDIRMPKMDGLEFIAESKKHYPDTKYLIMSAYNDFSYARKALQLGAWDYILKPIEEEEFEKVLEDIVQKLNEEHLTKKNRELDETMLQTVPFAGSKIIAVAFYIYEQMEMHSSIRRYLEQNPLINENKLSVYYLRDFSRNCCYVYLINGDCVNAAIASTLIQGVWGEIEGVRGAAAYSAVSGCAKAGIVARESVELLKEKMFYDDRQVLINSVNRKLCVGERWKELRERMFYICQYVYKKDYIWLEKELISMMKDTLTEKHSVGYIELFIREMAFILQNIRDRQEAKDFEIRFHAIYGKDYLLTFPDLDNLKDYLEIMMKETLADIRVINEKDIIIQIKRYIKQEFSNDINSLQISKKYHISTGYLSSLFKERTGMNLTGYIEGIRMEKAKQYLAEGTYSITDIATRIGYSDGSYFSRVFKRYTGMTPRQYREIQNNHSAKKE